MKGAQTTVWASEAAIKAIWEELGSDDARRAFARKLKGFADAGFWKLPDNVLRHEGKKGGGLTYRIAYKNSDLFRVIGFPESDNQKDFIILDAFYKESADDYSKSQWKRMVAISEIKRQGEWQKKQGNPPSSSSGT